MYKLISSNVVQKVANTMFIPFDIANNDYQQFKNDLAEGAELQDADGNVMSAEAVAEFLNTLE